MESTTTIDLIDAAKKKLGVESDYAVAKALDCSLSRMSNYRRGRSQMDDDMAVRCAEIAGLNPLLCLMRIQAERSKSPNAAAIWKQAAERLSSVVASFAVLALVTLSAAMPQTASASALPGQAKPSSMYIM